MKTTEILNDTHDFELNGQRYNVAFELEISKTEYNELHEPFYREHMAEIEIEVVDVSARIGSAEIYDKHILRLLRNQAQEWAERNRETLAFKAGL